MWVIEMIAKKNVCVIRRGTHLHFVTFKDALNGEWTPKDCDEVHS